MYMQRYFLIIIGMLIFSIPGTQAEELIFFQGGARSLGMGDATVSIPYKADAYFVNPAGLATVDRSQLLIQVSEPFTYDFFSYAHPLPKSFRLATGGSQFIYDLDQDGLYNIRERTFGVAVGRAWTEQVSFGAAFHLISQKYPGENTETGFGFNVGTTFRPMILSQPQFGVLLANVPNIAPNEDRVSRISNAAVQLGVAQRFIDNKLVVAFTHEIREDKKPRIHVGGELMLDLFQNEFFRHSFIRTGLNDDALALGFGVETRILTIDAAFQDDEIHLTATFEFGRSLMDQFNSYLVEGDLYISKDEFDLAFASYEKARQIYPTNETVQDKIENARKLREQRAETLFEEGQAFFADEQYDLAIQSWENVLKVKPAYPNVDDKIKVAKQARAEKVEQLVAQGRAALDEMNVMEAHQVIESLRLMDPQSENAKQLEKDIDQALNDEKERLIDEANSLLKSGQFRAATQKAEMALELDPKYDTASKLLARIRQAEIETQQEQQEQARLDRILELARAAEENEQWQKADSLYQAVLTEDKNEDQAKEGLGRVEQKWQAQADSLYDVAERQYDQGSFREAIRTLEVLLDIRPGEQRAIDLTINSHYKRGVKYYTEGLYQASYDEWQAILKLDPDNRQAQEYSDRARAKLESLNGSQ